MQISQLFIYPIKSLAGISVQAAIAEVRGFQHDRRWMLVDRQGKFLTQREHREMALLQPAIEETNLSIYHKTKVVTPLTFPLHPKDTNERIQVTVWKDTVAAMPMSSDTHQWFSEQLGIDCQLVYFPIDSHRQINRNHAQKGEGVSFADGYPYLIIGEASMKQLNNKLETPIPIDRFRPNLVFDSIEAHIEDTFEHFTIGNTKFRGIKPCVRCQIPNIAQETGSMQKEPNKTLATYRMKSNKIYFGQNVCLVWEVQNQGLQIRVGDKLSLANDFGKQ